MPSTQKIILFEYDKPLSVSNLLNYAPGIWFWMLTPGDIVVTDDNGNTGYYSDKNAIVYTITSLNVNETAYAKTTSYNDMYATNESFYYDSATKYLYVHFDQFEPPLDKSILKGSAYGSVYGYPDSFYYNNVYYRPDILKNLSYIQSH